METHTWKITTTEINIISTLPHSAARRYWRLRRRQPPILPHNIILLLTHLLQQRAKSERLTAARTCCTMEADIKDECPVQTGKGNNANLKTNKKRVHCNHKYSQRRRRPGSSRTYRRKRSDQVLSTPSKHAGETGCASKETTHRRQGSGEAEEEDEL